MENVPLHRHPLSPFQGGGSKSGELPWIPTLLAAATFLSPSRAAAVIVPDDYPPGFGWSHMPSIQSMEMGPEVDWVTARGVRFLGSATSSSCSGACTFESCRLDSGLTVPCDGYLQMFFVRSCMFLGSVDIAGYVQFLASTVIGGKVSIWADCNHDIRNNYIQGPAEAGLELSLRDSQGPVKGNTIREVGDGIRFLAPVQGSRTSRNEIAGCSGHDISRPAQGWSIECDSNSIARCGGVGTLAFDPAEGSGGPVRLRGNVIREMGLDGIHFAGLRIADPVEGIVVLDAGGCSHNTAFSNDGAGYVLATPARDGTSTSVGNIAAFNGGAGWMREGGGTPSLSYND